MAITVDRTGAEIIGKLALDELSGYAQRYPEAHAKYLALKQKPSKKQSKPRKGDEIGGVKNDR